ncbi:MAG: EI24 domain-containing protein [Alphaproteobacteria bacterium]
MLRAIQALIKTIRSLFDVSLWRLFTKSLFLTGLGLLSFWALVYWGFRTTAIFNVHWLDVLLDTIGGIGAGFAAWFLFPIVLPLIASLFQEAIAEKVESKHYKGEGVLALRPFWSELFYDIKFILYALFLNLLCLPLYMMPVVNVFVYYGLNSYLLGREFFEIAAARHYGKTQGAKLRKNHRFSAMTGGFFITFIANVPFLNLLSPFLGVVLMVHIFHSINRAKK